MMKNSKTLIAILITTFVFSTAWFVAPTPDAYAQVVARKIRLFAGFKLSIVKTKLKLAQIEAAPAGGGSGPPTVTTNTTFVNAGAAFGPFYWANVGGNITNIGGSNVTTRGFAWSIIASNLSAAATTTENGNFGTGPFVSRCDDLIGDGSVTQVYYRAYATNSSGTGYGAIEDELLSESPVIPCSDGG